MQELHRRAAPSTCDVYTYTARPTCFQTPLCHYARCHLQYYLTTSLRKLSYGSIVQALPWDKRHPSA